MPKPCTPPPAGSATPNRIRIRAENIDTTSPVGTVHTLFYKIGTGLVNSIAIPTETGLYDVLNAGTANGGAEVDLNGANTITVWADVTSVLQVYAQVDDQSSVAGAVSAPLVSGLVAAVQNASRYAVNAQGGTGQATEANAQVAMPRAGTLRNLGASAPGGAVGGGATVTVTVNKNGVATTLTLTLAAGDGTTWKQSTGAAVTFVAGDLIDFGFATNNVGAPAANIQAACELV